MTIGRSKAGSANIAIVVWKVDRSPTSGMNCLGSVSRDSGHTLVPDPPHMITGKIFFISPSSTRSRRLQAESAKGG
jgi:hypothetical protein